MPARNNPLLVAMCLLCAVGAAHSQNAPVPPVSVPAPKPPPVIGSKAVSDFYRRHQKAKTISFTATYYTFSGADVGFMQQNTYTVQARRPNLFAVRGGPQLMREPAEGYDKGHLIYMDNPLTVCVSDGKSLLEMSPRHHFYQKSPAPADFPRTPAALVCVQADVALSTEMLYGFAPAPDEQVYRTHAIVFAQTSPSAAGYMDVEKLYFAADTGELIRYSDYAQGKDSLEEIKRVEYSDWKFNVRLPRDTFTQTLPADARQFPPAVARTPTTPPLDKH